ncbi:MAG: hypothetical protein KF873_22395 [Gemmataceae bacterium]|nr:hypothetical protein [Gemmataceae bacterium]
MADGRDGSSSTTRQRYLWTEIFRCFLVALDPRKLLVAAAGILAVSCGWYVLSAIFHRSAPDEKATSYTDLTYLKAEFKGHKLPDGKDYADDDFLAEGKKKFDRDSAQWRQLNALAGPGGRLSTMPWYEDRGSNPYLMSSTILAGTAIDRQNEITKFWSYSIPTLLEPLVKLLVPVAKVFDKDISPMTRVYLLLCILWSLACWAYFAGIITRIAAVQLSGKDRIGLGQAVAFVTKRYLSYLLSPIVPLGMIGFAALALALLGLPTLLPFVGDLLYLVLVPLGLLGGFFMAALLVGLIGYPLMYTTLSVEGSDTFDALSRAYNYVMQAPWQYLWYCGIATLYGAAVTFVVVLLASLSVYLGKWALSQTPFNEYFHQQPDYLFIHAPESLGWKQLLLHGTPLEKQLVQKDSIYQLVDKNPTEAERYRKTLAWYNYAATYVTTFWLTLLFLCMLGFSYSFFWSAMTVVYLLMRRHVDEVDLDEIYLEDDGDDLPPSIMVPAPTPVPTPTPGQTALPMVPPPPATVPFTPPTPPTTP